MQHKYSRPRKKTKELPFEPRSLFNQPHRQFYRLPEMEIRGGRIIADGCRRIIEYNPGKLCVDFGRTVITFYGENIKIELLAGKRLVIAGRIQSISMSAAGDETNHAQMG